MEKTIEEKVDFIYSTLKKQESRYYRGIYMKWGLRILIIGYIYYFVVAFLPGMISNMKGTLQPTNIVNNLDLDKIDLKNIDKEELINKLKSFYNK